MAYSIDTNDSITLTRGDSFFCEFPLYLNGEAYELQEGDQVRFAVKADWDDTEPCICKQCDGYMLQLDPDDTKMLEFGKYWYDVEITFADGTVITKKKKKRLILDEEVH